MLVKRVLLVFADGQLLSTLFEKNWVVLSILK